MTEPLYYESHITIEPVFGERLERFIHLAKQHRFRVAKLLMQKDREATAERSDKDSFCTGHDLSFDALQERMDELGQDLRKENFQVWRVKIEAVLLDRRSAK